MNSRSSLLLRFATGCAVFGVVLLGGCATASNPTSMAATPVAAVTKHAESFNVNVTGGSETSSMGASKIANADFAEAVKTSIIKSGLFASTAGAAQADYLLDAHIVQLDQPMFGFSFTVKLEVDWRLVHRADQKVVWEKAVMSSFTATTSDAFAGVTRLRLANEGAARNNIQDAIGQMGALTLP